MYVAFINICLTFTKCVVLGIGFKVKRENKPSFNSEVKATTYCIS